MGLRHTGGSLGNSPEALLIGNREATAVYGVQQHSLFTAAKRNAGDINVRDDLCVSPGEYIAIAGKTNSKIGCIVYFTKAGKQRISVIHLPNSFVR